MRPSFIGTLTYIYVTKDFPTFLRSAMDSRFCQCFPRGMLQMTAVNNMSVDFLNQI